MIRYGYAHGVQRLHDGRYRFRLWAPAVEQVHLHLDEALLPMEAIGDGWFETIQDCRAGTPYYFEPEGVGKVPDPASRMQFDDVDGASVVVDHACYSWRHPDWAGRPWNEAVLYELHVGLLGGFDGVRRRLPFLAELGVTAIELMPVADFPGPRNWGYDGVLPYAPDRSYGTPDELKALIDAAHGLGVMVFLDVVYNHFGPVGNYLHGYAPDFFRKDVETPWGPAIDFRQPAVRSFFLENARYWLREYHFDGLRFDAVHAMADGVEFLRELAITLRNDFRRERHIHLVLENDDNAASLLRAGYDAQWNDDMHHVVHHLLTGETAGYYAAYAQRPTEQLARALAQGFIYQGEPCPTRGGQPRGEPSYMLPTTAFVNFLQNHDQVGNRALGERLALLCVERPQALAAAVALQLLCPAIPLIFMGEELGAETPFLYFTSFADPEVAVNVRRGRRAEFPDFHVQGGVEFPDPNSEDCWLKSRLPFSGSTAALSWTQRYRELLTLRARYVVPGLSGARCEAVEVLAKGALAARWRLGNGSRLMIFSNLSEERVEIAAGIRGAVKAIFHESVQGATAALQAGTLLPWCTMAGLAPAVYSGGLHG